MKLTKKDLGRYFYFIEPGSRIKDKEFSNIIIMRGKLIKISIYEKYELNEDDKINEIISLKFIENIYQLNPKDLYESLEDILKIIKKNDI